MPHLEGRDIVCFANDWSGDPLSKKHVMRRLAKRNRVLWINSLGNRSPRATARDLRRIFDKLQKFAGGLYQVEHNIHVLSPIAVPNYRSPLMRRLNQVVVGNTVRAAMKKLDFKKPLIYTFVPASAWVADSLDADQVVYHCVDEYSEFDGAGPEIAELERELIVRSDLVITCSQKLQDTKSLINPNTVLVRHGVEHELFAKALDPATVIPDDIKKLPKPIIGFYGLIAEWVDLEAMRLVAQAYPHGSLVILGEVNNARTEKLRELPNVHFLGRKKYEELPGYCKAFDVALLPFVMNELTVNANPLKLREYLAAGLPVVSTDIPEARTLESCGVLLAKTSADFPLLVGRALETRGPNRARSQAIAHESWDDKVAEIEERLLSLH
jgi:glycosyltransferase involved in cell wall biosynthesis